MDRAVELGDAGKGGGVLQEGHYPDGEARRDPCGRGLVGGGEGREGGRGTDLLRR